MKTCMRVVFAGLPAYCIALLIVAHYPANTKHLYNISTTSAQRLRRWPNIVEMLYKCFVLAG